MNVGDEDVEDLVAVLAHGTLHRLQDLCHHLFLGLVALVKGHGRQRGPQNVVHFSADLLIRTGNVKNRHLHHVLQDAVLHRSDDGHRDVILGLAVGLAHDLVHGQRDGHHGRAWETNAATSWLLQALVLTKLLHHSNGSRGDTGEAAAGHDWANDLASRGGPC